MKRIKAISSTTWQEIFDTWLKSEGSDPDWQNVALKKGWQTWSGWRSNWVSQFGAQKREWQKYIIEDPATTVPYFLVGPTQGWQKNFKNPFKLKHSFKELVKKIDYSKNPKIKSLLKNLPKKTQFIGIILENKQIVLIDGHHRATAITIAAQQNLDIPKDNVIVLTKLNKSEENLLDEMLKNGSDNICK